MKNARRLIIKIIKWGVILGLLLTVILAANCYRLMRRSLPEVDGIVRSSGGVRDAVEVVRDVDAVPHIYAKNRLDAYWGLGYVHAQDRLWQMEFQRRIGQGRLAELFGSGALPSDRFLRTLGINRAAQSAWNALPQESKEIVNSYVGGINAFIASHPGSARPLELSLLRRAPEPWTGPDVLALVKAMAFSLESVSYTNELLRNDIVQKVGTERAQQLLPKDPEDGPVIERASNVGSGSEKLVSAIADLQQLIGYSGLNTGGLGSNSWVVDGSKSTTGKPVLANDPHLMASIPSTWYLAHLSAGEFDVIGATIPGLPMIVIGRNRSISWGITHLVSDVLELFRERLDATGRMVEFQGQMEPVQTLTENIKVRGMKDVEQTVRLTRHGPIVSDVINANDEVLPADQRTALAPLEPMSFRWAAIDSEDNTLDAFLRLNAAHNAQEFEQALRNYVAPAMNFMYADMQGNIGYYAAGRIPNKDSQRRADDARPVHPEGWSKQDDWNGYLAFEDLPRITNPPDHVIITANNRPAVPNYKFYLSNQWFPAYRARRIRNLLDAKEKLSPQDHAAIQGDTLSLEALELLPHLLSLVTPQNDEERQAIELLKNWDRNATAESAATALYEAWSLQLPAALVGDELGSDLEKRYADRFEFLSPFMAATLKDKNNVWCDDVNTPAQENCGQVAERTFREALKLLKSKLGKQMSNWRWDQLHVAVFPHVPFHNLGFLRRFFSRSVPSGGDRSTVNIGTFGAKQSFEQNVTAGYRQIVDLSSIEGGRFIQAGGQSGHFLSENYDDYLADWRAIKYRPMRIERSVIEQDKKSVLRIEP